MLLRFKGLEGPPVHVLNGRLGAALRAADLKDPWVAALRLRGFA